ncbi:hypothetical protein Tco_1563105 [Tanacetum coccineum]
MNLLRSRFGEKHNIKWRMKVRVNEVKSRQQRTRDSDHSNEQSSRCSKSCSSSSQDSYITTRVGITIPPSHSNAEDNRVILFSIHNDEWKSFQCHHQTALRSNSDGGDDHFKGAVFNVNYKFYGIKKVLDDFKGFESIRHLHLLAASGVVDVKIGGNNVVGGNSDDHFKGAVFNVNYKFYGRKKVLLDDFKAFDSIRHLHLLAASSGGVDVNMGGFTMPKLE